MPHGLSIPQGGLEELYQRLQWLEQESVVLRNYLGRVIQQNPPDVRGPLPAPGHAPHDTPIAQLGTPALQVPHQPVQHSQPLYRRQPPQPPKPRSY